ncbi:MAG: hypothetical protein WAM92_13310 [Mycobacterium sp.]
MGTGADEVVADDLDGGLGNGVSLLGWDCPPTVSVHPATSSKPASRKAQRRMAATVSGEPDMALNLSGESALPYGWSFDTVGGWPKALSV